MIDTYEEIFKQRAQSYHEAMLACPTSRDQEFQELLSSIKIDKDALVADMPSGSCYLRNYLKNPIYFLDPTQEFLNNCSCKDNTIQTALDNTPIESNFFDLVINLAGTHHMKEKLPFYKEVYRILKADAIFTYADVYKDSKEDVFLNHFVDKYNSLGHRGVFLDNHTKLDLETIGFTIQRFAYQEYHWSFQTEGEMLNFIKKLFGLDMIDDNTLLHGLSDILGYVKTQNDVKLNWGLLYITAKK